MNTIAVFNKLDKLKPIFDGVYFVVLQFAKIFLVATIILACLMVAGRFIGRIPSFPWTEEIILAFMSYMTLLGGSLAVRRSAHIRMVALDPFLNKTLLKVLDVIADVLIIFFSILLITEGWAYAVTIGARGNFTSMPNVSLFWRFLPMPLGGLFMLIFSIEVTYNHIKAFFNLEGGEA